MFQAFLEFTFKDKDEILGGHLNTVGFDGDIGAPRDLYLGDL